MLAITPGVILLLYIEVLLGYGDLVTNQALGTALARPRVIRFEHIKSKMVLYRA